jgi:hypothetical protein
MARLSHTFLFRPGRWQSRGNLTLLGRGAYPFFGYSVIEAQSARTLENHVVIDAVGAGGPRLESSYRIVLSGDHAVIELDDGGERVSGEAVGFGDLIAVVASDSVGSLFFSETLVHVSDDEYRCTGLMAVDSKIHAAVRAVLRRSHA